MDLSGLPQSAQHRIGAAEIEAELILKRSKIPSQVARIRAKNPLAKPESWRDGSIQEQKRFEQSLFDAAAHDSIHQGRIQAARHLLGAAAEEFFIAGNLDIKQFDAKLESIGDWVCKKFRVKRAWFDVVKQGWRAARRKRPTALEAGESSKGTIIAKLPAEALVRMEADTAAFLAYYLPKLEREANKSGPIHDAELFRELVIHQFNLVARECMAVCGSVSEFEAELHSDIARFVRYGLSQYPWLADPMRKELDAGFALFVMRANPWAEIPEKDRASVWHVGAITGEGLTHAALKLRAEAWKHAAEGGFPETKQAGAAKPSMDESTRTGAGPAVNGMDPAESDGKGRKRGPKPDHEAASRVAEIVARVAPDGDWRPKLDDICEALDEAQIPFPPRWRKRDRSCDGWAAYDERANAVKAIEYRLEIATQRKKTTPETLS
jgi:hypothetical protein